MEETPTPTRIVVEIPTIEDEVRRVWHVITSKEKLTEKKLHFVTPEGLKDIDKRSFQEVSELTRAEYDPTFYSSGLERVKSFTHVIQHALVVLSQYQQHWNFKISERYRILLTRYGSGGSYNTKKYEVYVRTSRKGELERNNPGATPVHEITHLCVEHLVEKYELNFDEKERLVKGITMTLFPEIFDTNNKVSETEHKLRLKVLLNLPDFIKQIHI